ncbi:hypothetical protein LCGC14_2787920 [marine sediment metagenome]|uniref:Uncharacterized protein n=1 Tax=marine sediment metagenome TaxID=412755 RepID=A0A0F9B016_9ZZZZ
MGWSHIVIEAYCSYRFGKDKSPPCGLGYPSSFCLSNKICPELGYCKSDEREAALFVPLRLIIWDKTKSKASDVWWKIRYYAWDKWNINKRIEANKKMREIYAKTNVKKKSDFRTNDKEELAEQKEKFKIWFKEAKKEAKK